MAKSPHYIVCVDPGFANLGYAILDYTTKKIVDAGVVRTKKNPKIRAREDNVSRYLELFDRLSLFIPQIGVDAFAVEGMSHPRDARAAWKLALGWGVILALAHREMVPVYQYAPMEIKKLVTGNRKASKDDMVSCIKQRYPYLSWPKATGIHEHIADAVGAGICYMATEGLVL